METKYIIALEIGSSAIKAAAATVSPDNPDKLTLVAVEEVATNQAVRYGRIQNVEEVANHVTEVLDRLSKDPDVAPAKITGVHIAVGGRSLASKRVSIKLNLPDEIEITDSVVARLINEAGQQVPEGRELLDIVPLRFTVNDIVTHRPKGSYGSRISGEFTLIYCESVNLKNINRVLCERLKLDVQGFIVRPIAIANLVLSVDDIKPGCMLVDFGAETTTIAIFKGGAIRYVSTIPLGSRNITHDIATGMGVIEERAEQTKIRFGNAISDTSKVITNEQLEIDNYVQSRAGEIAANIFAHIGFAGMKPEDLPQGIILCGRGSKLKNFGRMLHDFSVMEVRTALVPPSVRIADSSINAVDHIDLISIALDGSKLINSDTSIKYVEMPEPEPVHVSEPIKPIEIDPETYDYVPGEHSNIEGTGFNDPGESDTSFNAYDNSQFQEAGNRGQYGNEDDILIDDDIAASRRKKEEEKRKKEQKKIEKIKEKEEERKRKSKKPSLLDKIKLAATNLISDSDDSAEFEDE